MLHEILMEYGLSDKAAKVYLSLLELEVATVNHISKNAGINRSSTYVVLESLKESGLVHITNDKKVQQYVATSPDVLLRLADESAQKRTEIKKKLEKVVPELKALYRGTRNRPHVRVFEGKQGLINAFEDTLSCREKMIRVSSSAKNLFGVLPDFFPEYLKERIQAGIKMNGIHPNTSIDKLVLSKIPNNTTDNHILIPLKKYTFPADLAIYDDKIAYMSLEGKGTAIIIESQEMAEVMKNVFDLAFSEAQKLSKAKK